MKRMGLSIKLLFHPPAFAWAICLYISPGTLCAENCGIVDFKKIEPSKELIKELLSGDYQTSPKVSRNPRTNSLRKAKLDQYQTRSPEEWINIISGPISSDTVRFVELWKDLDDNELSLKHEEISESLLELPCVYIASSVFRRRGYHPNRRYSKKACLKIIELLKAPKSPPTSSATLAYFKQKAMSEGVPLEDFERIRRLQRRGNRIPVNEITNMAFPYTIYENVNYWPNTCKNIVSELYREVLYAKEQTWLVAELSKLSFPFCDNPFYGARIHFTDKEALSSELKAVSLSTSSLIFLQVSDEVATLSKFLIWANIIRTDTSPHKNWFQFCMWEATSRIPGEKQPGQIFKYFNLDPELIIRSGINKGFEHYAMQELRRLIKENLEEPYIHQLQTDLKSINTTQIELQKWASRFSKDLDEVLRLIKNPPFPKLNTSTLKIEII